MKALSLLVKPASGACNLRCRYCFYRDVASHREQQDAGLMSEALMETMVLEAMRCAENVVCFAFQGGEPMLRGLPFYEKLVALVEQHRPAGLRVEYTIQTNGTLIDPAWADFFRAHHFLVGLSLDGTRELHDHNRVDALERGSWNTVSRALQLLQKRQVEVNLLCVVTQQLARRGQAVYQNLKKLGARYLQFIPCLDPLEDSRGGQPYSLTPQRYGQFLCTVFDLWYRDWAQQDYVSIRAFDDYVHLLAGHPAGTCATAGHCGEYFVVEADGSVYPCDFFVLDEWYMGKLGEASLDALSETPNALRFRTRGQGSPEACRDCQWLHLCNGGCQRDWVGTERNFHCEALKTFFAYAYPRLRHIAQLERQLSGRQRPVPPTGN